jgi:hypothetical protein
MGEAEPPGIPCALALFEGPPQHNPGVEYVAEMRIRGWHRAANKSLIATGGQTLLERSLKRNDQRQSVK